MGFSLTLISRPSTTPVTLAEAKKRAHIDYDDDDSDIALSIAAATEWVQNQRREQLITATYALTMDAWSSTRPSVSRPSVSSAFVIVVPRPPLQAVSGITYIDTDGATQTLAADQYRVNIRSVPGTITPAYGVSWPSVRDVPGAISVTYTAGYGDTSADVPDIIRMGIFFLVANWNEYRESVTSGGRVAEVPSTLDTAIRSGAHAWVW